MLNVGNSKMKRGKTPNIRAGSDPLNRFSVITQPIYNIIPYPSIIRIDIYAEKLPKIVIYQLELLD